VKISKFFLILGFTFAYATIFSFGMKCLLNLFSAALAISLDGKSVIKQYPRFIPFCAIAALLALIVLIVIFIFNLKISEKFSFSKKVWWTQIVCAVGLFLPMIKLWEILFTFWQKNF